MLCNSQRAMLPSHLVLVHMVLIATEPESPAQSADESMIFDENRNGAHYGVKIRAPHALVMTMLFKPDQPIRKNIEAIVKV
jgi:hypothetical protein